jgi:hypothetical protein
MKPSPARLFAIVGAFFLAASPAMAQIVRGTVLDSASGQPVAGAQVIALTVTETRAGQAVTGQEGRFALRLRGAGNYRLRVTRLGYSPRITQPIGVDSTFEASVRLWLTPLAVPLDTVNVVAEHVLVEKRLRYLVDAGFYERQRLGFGYFMTRAHIDSVMPTVMSDLFYGISGVRVACGGRSRSCDLLMRGATTTFFRGVCVPSVVLDGVLIRPGGLLWGNRLDELLNPFNIEAIEVYRSPAGVPVQYGGYLSPCGAIIAWSRR